MKLDEIVCWYQKKIGTYDKQQWEKTVEQKILNGFSSITLKNAKLKTELIDVDLVRGSTFPKAKPKQTLLTVIRFAILRYLFLPIYAQWWVLQTSPNTFGVLLFLYITQMINWAIYTYNVHRLSVVASVNSIHKININNNTIDSCNYPNKLPTNVDEHTVSITELLIPMALSLLLSLIHSQIVATNSVGSGVKSKRRRFSNASSNGHRVPPTRLRRRKKLVKLRSQDNNNDFAGVGNTINTGPAQSNLSSRVIKFKSGVEIFEKSSSNVPSNQHTSSNTSINTQPITMSAFVPPATAATLFACSILSGSTYQMSSTHDATTNDATSSVAPKPKLKLDLNIVDEIINSPTTTLTTNSCINPSTDCLVDTNLHIMHHLNRKRNVNWHSPVHHYAIETHEKQQQTSPQTTVSSEASSPHCNSSSSSSNNSKNNDQITDSKLIDDGVQEFYDHLIRQATRSQPSIVTATASASTLTASASAAIPRPSPIEQPAIFNEKRIICDDDGFESLNGKSSSGEEANSPLRTTDATSLGSNVASEKQRLRFRLNVGDLNCNVTTTKTAAEAMQTCEITKPASGFHRHFPLSSESNYERIHSTFSDMVFNSTARQQRPPKHESTDETDEEGADDAENILNSPASINSSTYNECTTSATEWLGVTTNSEECSYSSELNNSDDYKKHSTAISDDDYDGYDFDFTPTTILNPLPADRISCTIWDQRDAKKAQMTVLEISSSIIERVESMPETNDYIYIGIFFSIVLSLVPSFCRLCEITIDSDNMNEINYLDLPMLLWEKASFSFMTIFQFAFGQTQWERAVLIIGFIHRLCLTMILFTIFAVAERTFKQRFLYGKLFSHLTSSRRARKSNLPHFRLNKVRNIKTWLSVRSYLKKRGPQRSVDVIVSAAFIVTLLLLAFLSVEWLKDSVHLHSHLNLEALVWSATIGIFLLRFMTLGNKIHHKYRSVSVLITEQINLYLQIEQKPKKKEELMVSNSVLKLAADLLKELETPFKISGLSANPFLFTTIKVVILSALSGVLSEMLGFKLKLHKIKIK